MKSLTVGKVFLFGFLSFVLTLVVLAVVRLDQPNGFVVGAIGGSVFVGLFLFSSVSYSYLQGDFSAEA